MIKTILAPLGGGESDQAVLESALLVARPFGAHIDCMHNFIDAMQGVAGMPEASYLYGTALHSAMEQLRERGEARLSAALHHYAGFCERHALALDGPPVPAQRVGASMLQVCGVPADNLVHQARHHDLVVMARPRYGDAMPNDLPGRVLLQGGQPMLLVPAKPPRRLLDTVMIFWKDTAEAARALMRALPLLQNSRRVVLAAASEGKGTAPPASQAVLEHLRWHGVKASVRTVDDGNRPVMERLWAAAAACEADLLVMGAFSRGPMRELLFGGCTQAVLDAGELPVFIAH